MLVYGALLSPFVRKVCVALEEKGLPYELKMARPRDNDADFLKASPFGKIPALVDGDYALADSSAILAYVDAAYPAHPLIPADPKARGRAVWFDEYADTILGAATLKVLFHRYVGPLVFKKPGDPAIAAQGLAELEPAFAYLEAQIPAQGWLLGEDFTLADIAVAAMLRSLHYAEASPDPQRYPVISAWYERVSARPSWQKITAAEPEKRPLPPL